MAIGRFICTSDKVKTILGEQGYQILDTNTHETFCVTQSILINALKRGAVINNISLSKHGIVYNAPRETDVREEITLYEIIKAVQDHCRSNGAKMTSLYLNNISMSASKSIENDYKVNGFEKMTIRGVNIYIHAKEGTCRVFATNLVLNNKYNDKLVELQGINKICIRGLKVGTTELRGLFGRFNVKHIEIRGMDFGSVKTMESLCMNCTNLMTFAMYNCRLNQTVNIRGAFVGCTNIHNINIPLSTKGDSVL
jgi:hypothetical protein